MTMRSSRLHGTAAILGTALFIASTFFSLNSKGQTNYSNNGVARILIEGTSNIHDWEMESGQGKSTATVTLNPAGTMTALNNLSFEMAVQGLKSGKGAMDDNTYKAMKEKQFPTIHYTAASGTVKGNGGNSYTVTTNGKLTIAGTTRDVTLVGAATLNADKSLTVAGTYKFQMTDYNVTPPSIMFGTIKVGPSITVKFTLTMKP
jgi:polyisoprenoid-binding protein YceI